MEWALSVCKSERRGSSPLPAMNVVRYVSLQALESGDSLVTLETLQRGIRREHIKEGKGA